MPKKKLVRLIEHKPKSHPNLVEIEETDEELEEATDEEIESEAKLADFQSRFSSKSYKVRVDRFNPTEGDWEWVVRLPLDGFDPFTILPKYGGGRYRAMLHDEGSKFVKGSSMEFRFAEQTAPVEVKPKSPLEDPAMSLFVESMKAQNVMLMEMMKAQIAAQSGSPKGPDMMQMVDMMVKVMGVAPKDTGTKSVMEAITLFEKIRTLTESEEKESGGLMSELKEAIQLLPMLKQMAPQGPALQGPVPTNQPRILPPGTVVNPAATPRKPTVNGKEEPSSAVKKILFYIPKLEEAARDNEPPAKWADFILNVLEDEVVPTLCKEIPFATEDSVYERLLQAAKNPEDLEKIFVYAPTLLPHKAWVLGVCTEAVRILETEEPVGE